MKPSPKAVKDHSLTTALNWLVAAGMYFGLISPAQVDQNQQVIANLSGELHRAQERIVDVEAPLADFYSRFNALSAKDRERLAKATGIDEDLLRTYAEALR